MSDDQLYRVDIIERTETKRDDNWTITHSWECTEPVPYDGDWEFGIYLAQPSIMGDPVTHSVVCAGKEACRATAAGFVQKQSDMAREVTNAFVQQLRGGSSLSP